MVKNNYHYLAKNIAPSHPEIVGGEGVLVYDKEGNYYFDLSSQTCNLNLGHRHPVIISVIDDFLRDEQPYFISSRFESSAMTDLAEKLLQIAPQGLTKANVKLCNGSDAVEDALKRARRYHSKEGKNIIVAQYRSHHGESSETLSASGKLFSEKVDLGGSGNYLFVKPAYVYIKPNEINEEEYGIKCANDLEYLIKKRDDIAGVILELVQVTGGIIVQPKSYVKRIEEICRENNVTFIIDEVQTAFGWLGNMFASEYYGIKPDIIALGKGLSAGFPALAATLFREEYDNLDYGESEYTFGGEPLACKVALANINYLESSGILETVEEKSKHFMERLQKMKEKHPKIGDVRGLGLILGIKFANPFTDWGKEENETTERVYQNAFKNHLILRKAACAGKRGDVLIIKPPIIINHEEIEQSMDLLDKTLEECL